MDCTTVVKPCPLEGPSRPPLSTCSSVTRKHLWSPPRLSVPSRPPASPGRPCSGLPTVPPPPLPSVPTLPRSYNPPGPHASTKHEGAASAHGPAPGDTYNDHLADVPAAELRVGRVMNVRQPAARKDAQPD